MKCTIALTAALLLSGIASAEDFRLTFSGIGPLTIRSEIQKSGKGVRIHATATNESVVPIRKAIFCIRNRNAKSDDCAGLLWNTDVWQPGAVISWDESLQPPVKLGAYEIVVTLVMKDADIYYVHRLYVEPLEGNSGDMARDQLKALIVNTGWFTLVEDPKSADATLVGRSETWEAGSTSSTSGGTAVSGSVPIVRAIAGSASRTSSQGKTETIFQEGIALRLTLPNGESIWAWDDSQHCSTQKAKCVIDDLVETAKRPFVLGIH